jgi:sugar lactone lactonase YvrE
MVIALALAACSGTSGHDSDTPVDTLPPGTSTQDTALPRDLVTIVAGIPESGGLGGEDVAAITSTLSLPQDATPGPDGVFWVGDYNNHLIREVRADGTIHTILGSGFPAGGYGGPALDEPLDHPTMVLPDPADANILWVAATGNHKIGRLDRAAAIVSFPYGTGFDGFGGDGTLASAALFDRPSSVAFDDAGAMYVSDRMNEVVRRIGTDGIIESIVGTPGVAGYSGDGGPAIDATLNAPASTESDPGNRLDVRGTRLVIADTWNDVVREVDLAAGTIDTLATGFLQPHDVAIASDGSVYVADTGNNCVKVIDASGEVSVVAGICGTPGPALQGVPPLVATFDFPSGIAVDDSWVWVADCHNEVIRRFPR